MNEPRDTQRLPPLAQPGSRLATMPLRIGDWKWMRQAAVLSPEGKALFIARGPFRVARCRWWALRTLAWLRVNPPDPNHLPRG